MTAAGGIVGALLRRIARVWAPPETHWRTPDERRACESGAPDDLESADIKLVTCEECRLAHLMLRTLGPRSTQ